MSSLFFTLNTANSALQASQATIQTIDHNVANANTEGYSQQSTHLVASPAYTVPSLLRPMGVPGQMGTGVTVQSIMRGRDALLDGQYRYQNQFAGQWASLDAQYTQVQGVVPEPSPSGFSEKLSAFWNSWQTLADDPTNTGARATVQQDGAQLATTLNSFSQQMTQQQQYADNKVTTSVANINNYATQIANLNGQISGVIASGQQPNDLLDQRDLLLDKISHITPVTYSVQANGAMTVNLATQVPGSPLIQVARPTEPALVSNTTTNLLNVTSMGIPTYASSGLPYVDPTALTPAPGTPTMSPVGGELGASLQMRDTIIGGTSGFIAQLDTIAKALVYNVNAIHVTGYDASGTTTGTPFFQVSPPATPLTTPFTTTATVTAANITVSSSVLANPNNIATAGTSNAAGDSTIAQSIANIRNLAGAALSPIPGKTIQQAYDVIIATLGANAQQAKSATQSQAIVMSTLTAQRQSVGGVSIDEQMTLLVQFQHNYSAAARIITTVDSMLDTIIHHMGLEN